MEYGASQIRFKHIPKLEQIGDVTCCRTYLYCFTALLPQQNHIDQIASNLEQKFIFSAELYDIPEDTEVRAFVTVKRLDDYQAQVSILTIPPEEYPVYLFGIYTLPPKLEEIFGAIHSIQGQSRETWIYERSQRHL
jgi:hypothetical protein